MNSCMRFFLSTVLVSSYQVLPVSSLSIAEPHGAVIGRPFTLECNINRTVGNSDSVTWRYSGRDFYVRFYARECVPSIGVRVYPFMGEQPRITGSCKSINGEEVYAVHIDNITESMIGKSWICQYGLDREYITLVEQVPVTSVTLTEFPDTLRTGQSVIFTCVTSSSKPQACIRAYIRSISNVKEIDPGFCKQDSSSVEMTNRTLTFTVRAEENGAELYCNASNSVTDPPVRSQVYTLNVQFGPENAQLEADLRQQDGAVRVAENKTVTFTCTSGESNPAAVLSWYINNSSIEAAEISKTSSQLGPHHGYRVSQRYTTRVDRYQDDDVISCEAQRPGQAARVSPSLVLDVMYAPNIMCNNTQVFVLEGQQVNLSCEVKANPTPTIVWQRGINELGDNLTESFRHPSITDTMVVSLLLSSPTVDQSGVYHLSATNVIGAMRKDIAIRVVEFIPPTIKVISCSNGQASLVWASGLDESLLEYYKVEYRGTNEAWGAKLVKNPGNLKVLETSLTGLKPGTTYEFRIQPHSTVSLPEYITSNCTILADGSTQGKTSMMTVGLGVGGSAVGLSIFVVVMIFLRRRVIFRRKNDPVERRRSSARSPCIEPNNEGGPESTENPAHTISGTYENLRMRPISAPHYEEIMLRKSTTSECSGRIVYENVTVLNIST